MKAMHFGEFNPLDVLASTAATLQSGHVQDTHPEDGQDSGGCEQCDKDEDGVINQTSGNSLASVDSICKISGNNNDINKVLAVKLNTGNISDKTCVKMVTGRNRHGVGASLVASSPTISLVNGRAMATGGVVPSMGGSRTSSTNATGTSCVVRVVNSDRLPKVIKSASTGQSVVTLKEATTRLMYTSPANASAGKAGAAAGKTLTVLKINKGSQNGDHSYAVYSQLDKYRSEEDEGYCSRSSLDSPGQSWRSDPEVTDSDVFEPKESDSDPRSPPAVSSTHTFKTPMWTMSPPIGGATGTTVVQGLPSQCRSAGGRLVGGQVMMSPQDPTGSIKKPAKIVIVSRDANLRKLFASSSREKIVLPKSLPASATSLASSPTEITPMEDHGRCEQGTSSSFAVTEQAGPPMSGNPSTKLTLPVVTNSSADGGEKQSTLDLLDGTMVDGAQPTAIGVEETDSLTAEADSSSGMEMCSDVIVVESRTSPTPECKDSSRRTSSPSHPNHLNVSTRKLKILLTEKINLREPVVETKSDDTSSDFLSGLENESSQSLFEEAPKGKLPSHGECGAPSDHVDGSQSHGAEYDVPSKPVVLEAGDMSSIALGKSEEESNETETIASLEKTKIWPCSPAIVCAEMADQEECASSSASPSSSPLKADSRSGVVYVVTSVSSSKSSSLPATMTVSGKQSYALDPNSATHKYIIEDDVSPVTKFGPNVGQQVVKPLVPVPLITAASTSQAVLTTSLKPSSPKALTLLATETPKLVSLGETSAGPPVQTNLTPRILLTSTLPTGRPQLGQVTSTQVPAVGSNLTGELNIKITPQGSLKPSLILQSSSLASAQSSTSIPLSTAHVSQSCLTPLKTVSTVLLASPKLQRIPQVVTSQSSLLVSSSSQLPIVSCTVSSSLLSAASNTTPLVTTGPLMSHQMTSLPTNVTFSLGSCSSLDTEVSDMTSLDSRSTTPFSSMGTSCSRTLTPAPSDDCLTPLGPITGATDGGGAGGKINIKISGGVVVDISPTDDHKESQRKAATSIGHVGSLTFQPLPSTGVSPTGLPPVLSNSKARLGRPPQSTASRGRRLRVTDMDQPSPGTYPSSMSSSPEMTDPTSARTCHTYVKKKARLAQTNLTQAELSRVKQSAMLISRLHPLIDHDYCMFSEFSAEIQSSIIATTETKIKTERRYLKKTKAARTKAVRNIPFDKSHDKLKKRKYTKRKISRLLKREMSPGSDQEARKIMFEQVRREAEAPEGDRQVTGRRRTLREKKPKRHYTPRYSTDKNYVKITGSYQDQFVYFATKKSRGRERKPTAESQVEGMQVPATKLASVGGINVFDWYREMASVDKSKFGVVPGSGAKEHNGETNVSPSCTSTSNALRVPPAAATVGYLDTGNTPLHESEVADLVMDMMPCTGMETVVETEEAPMFEAASSTPAQKDNPEAEDKSTNPADRDIAKNSKQPTSAAPPPDLSKMVEEVKKFLKTMSEDDLKAIENAVDTKEESSSFTNEDGSSNGGNLSRAAVPGATGPAGELNLSAYFGNYEPEPESVAGTIKMNQPPPGTAHFMDLDDINDSDLLPSSDFANMSAILGDLASTSAAASSAQTMGNKTPASSMDSPTKTPASIGALFAENTDASYIDSQSGMYFSTPGPSTDMTSYPSFDRPLDKSELFPDMTTPSPLVSNEFSGVPELTTVTMYWNDLPGLVIQGKEYVRLVDIHKQMLPAKDTGILKKRCQMMGLEILNSSELQRDFLIRYMNAAKSKSTVVVSKEAAKTLISFYVEPRSRVLSKSASESEKDGKEATPETPCARVEARDLTSSDPVLPLLPRSQGASAVPANKQQLLSGSNVELSSPLANKKPAAAANETAPPPAAQDVPALPTPVLREASAVQTLPAPAPALRPALVQQDVVKRSARLRNKKVQYAAMLQGWALDEEDSPPSKISPLDKPPKESSVGKLPPTPAADHPRLPLKSLAKHPLHNSHVEHKANKNKVRKTLMPEEIELRHLINRQKHKRLSKREKIRLKKIREKIRRLQLRSRTMTDKQYQERRGTWLKNLEKARQKQKEKRQNKLNYNQEHCYATYSSASTKQRCGYLSDEGEVVVASEAGDVAVVEHTEAALTVAHTVDVLPLVKCPAAPKKTSLDIAKRPPLEVVHRDAVHRSGKRGRSQLGDLHIHLYKTKDSPCIWCSTCRDFYSVNKFLKHLHHLNNPDELYEVSIPQKMELRNSSPQKDELALWEEFEQRKQDFIRNNKNTLHANKMKAKGSLVEAVEVDLDKLTKEKVEIEQEDLAANMTGGTRHSQRSRKRKQLHPIEKYVYSKMLPNARQPERKKGRFQPKMELCAQPDIHTDSR